MNRTFLVALTCLVISAATAVSGLAQQDQGRPRDGERGVGGPPRDGGPGRGDRPGREDGPPRDGGPGRGGPEMMRLGPLMVVLDKDRDGVISSDEIDGAVASLRTLDHNQDGKLDIQELRPPMGGRGPEGRGPEGRGPEGRGPEGRGPEGRGPEGRGPEGRGPDGRGPEGRGPEGRGPEGRGPEGRGPEGRGPEGRGPEGRGPEGRGPEGHGPEGRGPEGRSGDRGPSGVEGVVARMMSLDKDNDSELSKEEVGERLASLFDRADSNHDGVVTKAEFEALAAKSEAPGRRNTDGGDRPRRPPAE